MQGNMNRRQFLIVMTGATALLGAVRAAHAECGEEESDQFVEALYTEQARLNAANTPLEGDRFYALFTRKLRHLMQAARHDPTSAPDGRALNAFFGWGVLSGTEIEIGKVARVSGSAYGPATVSVELDYRGEHHKVMVRAVQENESWRVANISYDSGESLVDHYRHIARV
jgi:hypothetical protein